MTEELYEVKSMPKNIKLDLPIHIAFCVYQYAKLKMLEFHFDFVVKYIDERKFQLCYTGTTTF